ncbi:MAG TPA: helix-turn-helix transcriptional regulator [Chloroflexota bacterium]|jgi:transcriptional regulator with XRE-family HTH domain|nr:helix-turn-helix transcriptional regulator [Chloroflexota bacterium]
MAGHRKFRDLVAPLHAADPDRQRRVQEGARRLLQEARLANLRRARAYTQVQLAEAMGKPQSTISRIERETDLYLSTLRSYVEAMGGELELAAVFPDGRIPITTLRDLQEEEADEPAGEHGGALTRAG